MKAALLKALNLHLSDADKGFLLRMDASDYAMGVVLDPGDITWPRCHASTGRPPPRGPGHGQSQVHTPATQEACQAASATGDMG